MLWSVVCAAGLAAAQEPLVETGKHFVLEFHTARLPEMLALRLAADSLAAAEGAWPAIERLLLPAAGKPLRIVLYRSEADFRRGAGAAVAPFAQRAVDADGPVAHVWFWPELQRSDLERIGLPVCVRDSLVLAAAEVTAAQRTPALAKDPWLLGVFAYAVLEGKAAQNPKYGVDPLFDSRRWHHHVASEPKSLRYWVTTSAVPGSRDAREMLEESMCLCGQLVAGAGGDWARRWLAAPASKVAEAVALMREAAVERLLGKDWTKIEARWQRQLRDVKVPLYVRAPVVQPDGKRFLIVGAPAAAASIASENAPPAGSYRLAFTATLAPGDGEENGLRVQVSWDGASWLGLFLRPGEVELAEWRGGDWSTLATGKAATELGKPFDVVVQVATEGSELRVLVDTLPVLRWSYGQRDMHGPWSIAKNDRPAWIEGLRVEPLEK